MGTLGCYKDIGKELKINIQLKNYNNNAKKTMDKTHYYRVTEEYISPYPHPTIFQKGDSVIIGEEFTENPEWKNWIWCEGTNNRKAWVPKQYLVLRGKKGTFKREYNAMELSVSVGDRLFVYEILNGFALAEKTDGVSGWVPLKNIEVDET